MGVALTRLGVLIVFLGLWGWCSYAPGHEVAPAVPAASLTAVTIDDGGDWLPALVSTLVLPGAIALLAVVVRVVLPRPIPCVRVRTTRSRAPPAG